MRLFISLGESSVNELKFDRGHDALGGKSPVEYARSFSPLTLNAQAKGRKEKTAICVKLSNYDCS